MSTNCSTSFEGWGRRGAFFEHENAATLRILDVGPTNYLHGQDEAAIFFRHRFPGDKYGASAMCLDSSKTCHKVLQGAALEGAAQLSCDCGS